MERTYHFYRHTQTTAPKCPGSVEVDGCMVWQSGDGPVTAGEDEGGAGGCWVVLYGE